MGRCFTFAAFPLVLAVGCHAGVTDPPGHTAVGVSLDRNSGVHFTYASLDERAVSSEAFRGRPVVLAFVTTWDLMSQAQVDYLIPMATHDGDAVAYALIALQEPKDRELVEVYGAKLGVKFPMALADPETIAGGGAFGDVHNVPTVVVLDRQGRIAWQKTGLAKSDELRNAMRGGSL